MDTLFDKTSYVIPVPLTAFHFNVVELQVLDVVASPVGADGAEQLTAK